ncbi:ABC transporter substrate-binding protein [Paenibacillaceae bacterium WGS1546]|uniref:ABC transporter substrate-binding protein n=1 Tax=Cohnella sp. WGS1546 TaxID=3366810 RepID=UPI00372CFAFB
MQREKNGKASMVLLCAVLVLTLLAGCSGNKPEASSSPSQTSSNSPSASPEERATDLSGTIRISLASKSNHVWNAVGEAYMKKNPGVKVIVDNKPGEGYKEWLTAQFAAGTPDVDMVVNNEVEDLKQAGKFVDYYPFLEKDSPYTGKKWKESFDLGGMGINLDAVSTEDHLYDMSFESIQVVWAYNKEIFDKAGITETPETFDQLLKAMQKVTDAGYTGLALAGGSNSFWTGRVGWLMGIYADQYMRDSVNIFRSQEQDYTYLPSIDDQWQFDPSDPYNDSPQKVTFNDLRALKAIKDKVGPYKIEGNPQWKESIEHIKALLKYTPKGFFGLEDEQAYQLFLTGKAATILVFPDLFWQLPKDLADAAKTGVEGGVQPFEFGFFNMPSIEGPEVMAPARSVQIPIGYYGFVQKDAKQTELNMDFMMYLTSPEGYSVYLQATQESKDASLAGPPMIKDVVLPDEMKEVFANFEPIGHFQNGPTAAGTLPRGLWDYQPSVQDWIVLIQKYLNDEITTDEYLTALQANVDQHFEGMLKARKLELSDLENPERRPPERS